MTTINEVIMSSANDHIMANIWRLIFEGKNRSTSPQSKQQPVADFSALEQLLPEYRLMGLYLADSQQRRRYD